jgi:hypothetical protein
MPAHACNHLLLQDTSVDQLAGLRREAVNACCQLTSATLQKGCWDACSPPPAVSQEVLVREQPLPAELLLKGTLSQG